MKQVIKNCSNCPCYYFNSEYMSSSCGLDPTVFFYDSLGPKDEPANPNTCPLLSTTYILVKESK